VRRHQQPDEVLDGPGFFRGVEILDDEWARIVWELRAIDVQVVLDSTKTQVRALIREKRRRLRQLAKNDKSGFATIVALGTWGA
jgi:hypothetical protein